MALINTFSWKYCQLDVVVRRCSDSVSDHLGHVKVDICDLSRCTWKRSNGTACTVAYPPHLHGPVRISGNFVPDHFHPWCILINKCLFQGIVVKFNANQRYATTAVTTALLREIASRAEVPLQVRL